MAVRWCPKRAEKDAHDRRREVERLERQLARSDSPGDMASLRGRKRFLSFEGKSRAVLDEEKVAQDERWDGLSGVYTDDRELEAEEALAHCHGLWKVEESFRVVKHDLRVRPVFHWTEERIRAHIAICFMAFACVRHLAYRVAVRKERMSPERIRRALLKRGMIVSRCLESGHLYALPSKPGADTKTVYGAVDLPLNMAPFKIS